MERQVKVFSLILVTSLEGLILMRFMTGQVPSVDATAPHGTPLPVEQTRVTVFRTEPAVTGANPAVRDETASVEPRCGVGSEHVRRHRVLSGQIMGMSGDANGRAQESSYVMVLREDHGRGRGRVVPRYEFRCPLGLPCLRPLFLVGVLVASQRLGTVELPRAEQAREDPDGVSHFLFIFHICP